MSAHCVPSNDSQRQSAKWDCILKARMPALLCYNWTRPVPTLHRKINKKTITQCLNLQSHWEMEGSLSLVALKLLSETVGRPWTLAHKDFFWVSVSSPAPLVPLSRVLSLCVPSFWPIKRHASWHIVSPHNLRVPSTLPFLPNCVENAGSSCASQMATSSFYTTGILFPLPWISRLEKKWKPLT